MDVLKGIHLKLWRRAVKEGLDRGLRPLDMKLSVEGLLHEGNEAAVEDIVKQIDTKLELTEAKPAMI